MFFSIARCKRLMILYVVTAVLHFIKLGLIGPQGSDYHDSMVTDVEFDGSDHQINDINQPLDLLDDAIDEWDWLKDDHFNYYGPFHVAEETLHRYRFYEIVALSKPDTDEGFTEASARECYEIYNFFSRLFAVFDPVHLNSIAYVIFVARKKRLRSNFRRKRYRLRRQRR
ncbi:hypothetical protein HOLleu_12319 [Holothuria leucospilota]|uniref:Uncharacterized protein n=1 Tax=Holothuria leucospilota TaxID=206669 RepID=A0A9Q1HCZ2_HOLLE|nr:hypothetical protein HOLleu_12319 [Holothuria leucospilota]